MSRLRQIPDARWSATLKSWHVPYTKEVFAQLKELFPEVEYVPSSIQNKEAATTSTAIEVQHEAPQAVKANSKITEQQPVLLLKKKSETKFTASQNNQDNGKAIAVPIEKSTPIKLQKLPAPTQLNINADIEITVSGKQIIVKMPKNETDIQFVRSFKYVRWDKNDYKWVIPNYGQNLDVLKSYFGERINKIETIVAPPPKPIPSFDKSETITDLPYLDETSEKEMLTFTKWMEHKRYSRVP